MLRRNNILQPMGDASSAKATLYFVATFFYSRLIVKYRLKFIIYNQPSDKM